MPLEGTIPYDPAGAEEDLAQRATEETGSGGDVHLHAERKASEMAQRTAEDNGAGGDMSLHANASGPDGQRDFRGLKEQRSSPA